MATATATKTPVPRAPAPTSTPMPTYTAEEVIGIVHRHYERYVKDGHLDCEPIEYADGRDIHGYWEVTGRRGKYWDVHRTDHETGAVGRWDFDEEMGVVASNGWIPDDFTYFAPTPTPDPYIALSDVRQAMGNIDSYHADYVMVFLVDGPGLQLEMKFDITHDYESPDKARLHLIADAVGEWRCSPCGMLSSEHQTRMEEETIRIGDTAYTKDFPSTEWTSDIPDDDDFEIFRPVWEDSYLLDRDRVQFVGFEDLNGVSVYHFATDDPSIAAQMLIELLEYPDEVVEGSTRTDLWINTESHLIELIAFESDDIDASIMDFPSTATLKVSFDLDLSAFNEEVVPSIVAPEVIGAETGVVETSPSTPVSGTDQTSRTLWQEPPEYFEPGKTDNCDPNIHSSGLTADELPVDRFVYDPGIIFSDEAFTVMRRENSFGASSVTVPSYYPLRAYGDDDVPNGESYPEIQLFDDGTNGDLLANDGVYTRACLTVPYDLISDRNFTELLDLWVLDPSLRGSEAVFNNGNGVQINDSGFFIDIGDDYHKRWSSPGFLLFPGACSACQLILELFGDQFDFFSINTRDAVGGGSYIRVHDNIDGTGLTPSCANRSHCHEFPDGQEHQRLMGIINIWWPEMGGVTHEIGHGLLGIEAHDFPGPGIEAWNSGDGMHIDSDTTVVSNLMGPFWDPDRGWPYPVKLITPEFPEWGTEVYLTGNPDDGFRIEPRPLYRGRDTVHQIWSDIFLYMMGLVTPEEASGEIYYKLVNATMDGCESRDDMLLCTSNEVTAEKVIPFTTADFISKFGDWSLTFGEKTNRWNLGVLNISDRPHTEAEVTFLTKVWREYATSDTYENSWTNDVPWSYSTRGLSSINIDATQMLVSNATSTKP